MRKYDRLSALAILFLLLLGLTACSGGGNEEPDPDDPKNSWDILSREDFDADCTAWQAEDGTQLLLQLDQNTFTMRTWYGGGGDGLIYSREEGLEMVSYSAGGADAACNLVREGNGFTVRHISGLEGLDWGVLNGMHFEPAQGEVTPFDVDSLDGMWQNALGVTIGLNTEKMRYVIAEDITLGSWPLYDNGKGAGIYMGGEELLYPVLSPDGNALVLLGRDNATRSAGSTCIGVFYRNGAVERYADLANARFESTDGDRLWYYDGVQYFAVPAGFTLAEDGQAYDGQGNPFAPEWPAERYDAEAVWGVGWMSDNWGSNP